MVCCICSAPFFLQNKQTARISQKKKSKLVATTIGFKKKSRTVCAYFQWLQPSCQDQFQVWFSYTETPEPKNNSNSSTWLKTKCSKNLLFVHWCSPPSQASIPCGPAYALPTHTSGQSGSNNSIMKHSNSVQAPWRNLLCISNKFSQNKCRFMK